MIKILNEEMHINASRKLRDIVHDTIVKLEKGKVYNLGSLSNILRSNQVFITPDLLDRTLTLWDEKDNTSIFKKSDEKWLKWDPKTKRVGNGLISSRSGVLGKSKRRMAREEEKDVIKTIRGDGWRKSKTGDWIFIGTRTISNQDIEDIDITKYEKSEYQPGENPIKQELITKSFVLHHPDNALDIIKQIDEYINSDKIKAKCTDGAKYYDELWRLMMAIGKESKLDRFRDYMKYASSKVKEIMIKKHKEQEEKEKESKKFDATAIKDREEGLEKLKKMVDLDKEYSVIVLKKKASKYFIKKLIHGYVNISSNKWSDGTYKIVFKLKKNSTIPEDDVIFFDSLYHLHKAMSGGLEGEEEHIFTLVDNENKRKIDYYMKEFNKFKGWDEYLKEDEINNINNDF